MEEKKLNEQESLELITQMINQTRKETAVGSGAKSRTICRMTDVGHTVMQKYVNALKTYFTAMK